MAATQNYLPGPGPTFQLSIVHLSWMSHLVMSWVGKDGSTHICFKWMIDCYKNIFNLGKIQYFNFSNIRRSD